MSSNVLGHIGSDSLRVNVVWEPILGTDSEAAARKATTLFHDRRVTHYWTAAQGVGKAFQAPVGLAGEPAWDVYLVYERGSVWGKKDPPPPVYFMHQLSGRLPPAQRLDAAVLADTLRAALSRH